MENPTPAALFVYRKGDDARLAVQWPVNVEDPGSMKTFFDALGADVLLHHVVVFVDDDESDPAEFRARIHEYVGTTGDFVDDECVHAGIPHGDVDDALETLTQTSLDSRGLHEFLYPNGRDLGETVCGSSSASSSDEEDDDDDDDDDEEDESESEEGEEDDDSDYDETDEEDDAMSTDSDDMDDDDGHADAAQLPGGDGGVV